MNDQDKPSGTTPTLLVALLALLGFVALPVNQGGRGGSPAGSPSAATSEEAEGHGSSADAGGEGHGLGLGPLELLAQHWEGLNPPDDRDGLLRKAGGLKFLIVTVPDPDDTSISHEFDSTLAAVLRAAESESYVAERHKLPWEPRERQGAEPSAGGPAGKTGGVKLTLEFPGPKHEPGSRLGAILLRSADEGRGDGEDEQLLMVLLVPEAPAWGVDKTSLIEAITLVGDHSSLHHGEVEPIRIVGPMYSGSFQSLAQGLAHDTDERTLHAKKFVIVNGSAQSPPTGSVDEFFEGASVEYRSTVHTREQLVGTLIRFLRRTTPLGDDGGPVALLVEAGSPFGLASQKQPGGDAGKSGRDPDVFSFPMGVSRIRREYTAKGFYRPNEPLQLATPERLSLQAMTARQGDRDLMPVYSPGTAAVEGELVLAQVLRELERGRYTTIGIVATNAYDRLFLAYKVREACPDARLTFTSSSSLYNHKDIIPYLRGSLVVSSYPLELANQSWSASPAVGKQAGTVVPRVGFPHYDSEGIYNAAVAQVAALVGDDRPALLDYGMPGRPQSGDSVPPIWISVVGQRGLYPLAVEAAGAEPRFGGLYHAPEFGWEIRTEPGAGGVAEIPTRGRALIVATEQGPPSGLHLRVLGADGKRVLDVDEGTLRASGRGEAIGRVRRRLEEWSSRGRGEPETSRVVDAVSALVGRPLRPTLDPNWVGLFLSSAGVLLLAAGWSLWRALGRGSASRGRGGRRRPALDEVESSGHRLATLAIAASTGLVLYLGLPAWGFARIWAESSADVTMVPLTWTVEMWLVLGIGFAAVLAGQAATLLAAVRPSTGRADAGSHARPADTLTAIAAALLVNLPLSLVAEMWLEDRCWRRFLLAQMAAVGVVVVLTGAAAIGRLARRDRRRAGAGGPDRGRIVAVATALGAAPLAILPPAVAVLALIQGAAPASWGGPGLRLDCERMSRLTNGVTPMVPLLLLALASGTALVVARKRLELRARLGAARIAARPPSIPDASAWGALGRVGGELASIRRGLASPMRGATRSARWALAALLVLGLASVFTIGCLPGCLERRGLQWSFLAAFGLSLLLVALRLIELVALWRATSRLLRAVAELPMVRAFDRLPTRLALSSRHFGLDLTPLGSAADPADPVVDRQFQAVAEGYPRARAYLEAHGHATPEGRGSIGRLLRRARHARGHRPPHVDSWTALDAVLPILAPFWASRSSTTAYGTSTGSGASVPGPTDEWPGLEGPSPSDREAPGEFGHELDRISWEGYISEDGPTRTLRQAPRARARDARRWLRDAEDLTAMILARHLAWIRDYVSSIETFLVVGLIAITLAATSYPFQPRGPLLSILGLLAAASVATVLAIAFQVNRDDVTSRINKTTPNRFNFDGQLVITLLKVVVPLACLLVALSYGTSDLVRSWLEPLFR